MIQSEMNSDYRQDTIGRGIKRELRAHCDGTNGHGLSRISGSEKKALRVAWALIYIVASGGFANHLLMLSNRYFSFSINTSTSYKTLSFQFPAITICNLIPFSLRKLEFKDPKLIKLRSLDPKNQHFEEQLEKLLEGTENDKYNLILSCSYNSERCGAENFTEFDDPQYKKCFTFTPTEEIMANAPDYGLNLLLFAEHTHIHTIPDLSFSISNQWESSGIRLVIHERGTRAYPNLRGISVQPGVSSRFAIGMQRFDLYKVFKNNAWRCDDDQRRVEHCKLDSMETSGSFKEVTEDCYVDVIQKLHKDRCNCLSENYEVPKQYCAEKPINSSRDFCDSDNPCFKQLKTDLTEKFHELVGSKCLDPCNQLVYLIDQSTSLWPSHISETQINDRVRLHHEKLTANGLNSTLDEYFSGKVDFRTSGLLIENFLKISVYANEMTSDKIVEQLSYPLPNYVSEVGGVLGLWLGGSVLTMVEPFVLIAKMIRVCATFKRNRKNDDPNYDSQSSEV